MSMTTKKKTTIGAVAAVTAAVVALGIGTFAFFSSTEDPTTTEASAGTLQLNEASTDAVRLENFAPGGPPQPRDLVFTNAGSLGGTLRFAVKVADTEDGCKGDEATADAGCVDGSDDSGELSKKLEVTVKDSRGNMVYGPGPVSSLTLGNAPLSAGEKVTYVFSYRFPEGGASDNAAQGDSATVTTTATLEQPPQS